MVEIWAIGISGTGTPPAGSERWLDMLIGECVFSTMLCPKMCDLVESRRVYKDNELYVLSRPLSCIVSHFSGVASSGSVGNHKAAEMQD